MLFHCTIRHTKMEHEYKNYKNKNFTHSSLLKPYGKKIKVDFFPIQWKWMVTLVVRELDFRSITITFSVFLIYKSYQNDWNILQWYRYGLFGTCFAFFGAWSFVQDSSWNILQHFSFFVLLKNKVIKVFKKSFFFGDYKELVWFLITDF